MWEIIYVSGCGRFTSAGFLSEEAAQEHALKMEKDMRFRVIEVRQTP